MNGKRNIQYQFEPADDKFLPWEETSLNSEHKDCSKSNSTMVVTLK